MDIDILPRIALERSKGAILRLKPDTFIYNIRFFVRKFISNYFIETNLKAPCLTIMAKDGSTVEEVTRNE